MNILLTTLILSTSLVGVLAQTNRFYITDESRTHHGDTIAFSAGQIEKAQHAKDSRPAEDDPEGHWGTVSEGFQLSIRFEKATFTNGEPVVASIILRNVSERPLTYWVTTLGRETEVALARGQQRIPRKDELKSNATFAERLSHLDVGSAWDCTSPVGTQRKFRVELDKIFDLTTNGQYIAQATRSVLKLDLTGEVKLTSGKAVFHIADPPDHAAPPK